jgi:hypothetical protein
MEREEMNAMSSLITVRYHSGDTEFRMSDDEPKRGDLITRNGENWVVAEVVETPGGFQVMLRPVTRLEAAVPR